MAFMKSFIVKIFRHADLSNTVVLNDTETYHKSGLWVVGLGDGAG